MAAADRHLLFGLLALQNGIINQSQLVHAFQAWTLDKSKGLADHLEARGDLTTAKRALLEALAEVHLEAHGGDVEKSLAAVPAGKSTREDLARLGEPEIEASLGHVASGHGSTEEADSDRTAFFSVGAATSNGQRFRILRPHARGGLGQVSVARDQELNREVALKELRPERADDPGSRARFLLEAEVTGRLEHPGVVPVYGLGSDAQGRPYYAMRFVKGQNLKEAIDRFHEAEKSAGSDPRQWNLALRQLLNRFVAVCNVLAYAHSRGVIHRDLKPANVLLGPYGETLVVDWGLAKVVGRGEEAARAGAIEATLQPGSGSGSSETLPGTALGTPAYMSPEQAEGRLAQVGPLSDVYSLGATLFYLLTGKPSIEETDVGVALRRVQRGEFSPPRAVRPGIPPGLEAICLKAMAMAPKGRYASPRALADEIEHWLADEPVSVYREPVTARLTRWGRRHRTLASSLGVLLVTAVVGLAIATALIRGEQLRTEHQKEVLRRKNYIGSVNLALSECLTNNITQALELLDGCPRDLRGWEWDYTWRQCHLDLATFRQSGEALNGVAFNPDGTRVASVSGAHNLDEPAKKGDLVVRDVASGQEIFSHPNVPSGFRGVAFSPDGRWIATGNASDLVILNAETGKQEFRLRDLGNRDSFGKNVAFPVRSLAFSPDSRRIIAGYGDSNFSISGGHANLWDLASRKHERVGGNHGIVYSVAFSRDGREVAVARRGLVELVDLNANPRQIRSIHCHDGGGVYAVAFSPDGQYLASGGLDRTVRLWDRATRHEIRAFYGHEGFVRALTFSPDSKWLLSASEDYSLKLWEIASGRSLADLHGHEFFTSCVAFSPDGRLVASGGQDHAVKLWSATRRAPLTFTGHDGAVCGLEFLPRSQRLVSGAGYFGTRTRGRLKLWDATTGDPLEPSFESCPGIRAIALHSDGRRFATAQLDRIPGFGTVRVWDLDTGQPVWEQAAQAAWVTDVAYSPDGRLLASAGQDERELGGEVTLWDAETGAKIRNFGKHTAGVHGVAFSPDGRWLASGWGDGIVRIWDVKDPDREARELPRHVGSVERVVFLPDGRLASAGGRSAASGTSGLGEVKIWDLSTRRELNFRGHTGMVKGLACSPDGRRLATGSEDRTVKLWDTTTGEEVFTLRGHTGGVICVAFSPDGQRIASGGWDRTVRVWDTSPPASHDLFRRGAESLGKPPELPADPFARDR